MNNFYELVKSDNDIIKIYNEVNDYENREKQMAYHDYFIKISNRYVGNTNI